ncbi:ImmA/IrrE family metallo-endopeptidase [Kineococcus sp. NBC_00420]|uniref:ImmA/IrrE family metallo-endopeptidase n=1 Tax=Kineococcus sp. NBC_00420 TaxID=2903564 RepID=UPI002E1E1DE4
MSTYIAEEMQLDWAPTPGRMLQRELEAQHLSQAQLSVRTGLSTKHINLVIKGRAPLSPEVAVTLEQVLGGTASTWLGIEARYRARLAQEEHHAALAAHVQWAAAFPRQPLIERRVIDAEDDPVEVVSKLLSFFKVASPDAFSKTWLEPQASYKRSQRHSVDPHLTAIWLRLAEAQAENLIGSAPAFNAAKLRETATQLPVLTRETISTGFRRAQELLLACGVVLVFVPEMKSTRISGVSRWVAGHPIIAVTSRYKYFDSFWFTLFHEIAHVLLHPRRATYIDYTSGRADDDGDDQETAANDFAARTLLPVPRTAVVEAKTPEAVRQLADQVGVSVGVVAGQRAFMTKEWGGTIAKLRLRGDLEDELSESRDDRARWYAEEGPGRLRTAQEEAALRAEYEAFIVDLPDHPKA